MPSTSGSSRVTCAPVTFESGVAILKSPKVATRVPSSVSITPSFEGRSKKGNNSGK